MKIGIGALITSNTAGVRQSGIHRYAVELVGHLGDALGNDRAVVYTGSALNEPGSRTISISNPSIPVEHPAVRIAWENLVFPLRAERDRIDLFHGLAFTSPRAIGVPSMVTVHDLAFLRWPEQVPGRRSQYLSRAARDSVRRAERVIAVSEHTKRDVIELLEVPEDRIDVTPLGVARSMRRASIEHIKEFRARQQLSKPYILAVGNLEPRKNLATLVQAFASVANQIPHDLVLAGAEGWRTEPLHQALDDSMLEGRVRLPGFVSPEDLPLWYSACDFFVIPSLYEGFGLTLLEALSCGAPAIAANRASLPEVAGDAAMLVEPDVESLATALLELAGDQELRAQLAARGPVQAAHFTWQRTAELTVASYRKAVS